MIYGLVRSFFEKYFDMPMNMVYLNIDHSKIINFIIGFTFDVWVALS